MARLPRLTVAGLPHHIIQRGNNRKPIFTCDSDRQFLLGLLTEHAKTQRVAVHSYVLMDNHFHLLVTPEDATGVPKMMQAIGRRYVRHFNDKYDRTGTLWEGRYRSTLLQADRHLLACMVYVDMNPVRAGMVIRSADYCWSSCLHYMGVKVDPLVTPHALYWTLGNTPFAREAEYQAMLHAGLGAAQQDMLTHSTLQGWAMGDAQFIAQLQAQTGRRVQKAKAGRPTSIKPHVGH